MPQNNQFTISDSINGDSVIGFTSVKSMKNANFLDASKVSAYLMGEEGPGSHKKHLGLIQLFETTHNVSLPMMKDLFRNSAVLEVEEGQSITYDLVVNRNEMKCMTAEDTSDYQDYPGIDGAVFQIILNEEFTKGDVLTYDPMYGEQIMVSNEHDVEPVGENFRHWVVYATNDKTKWFPKDKLKAGIQYMKIDHRLAEYDTAFSGINMIKNPTGTITNEYLLGSPRGVETFYTRAASRMKAPGFSAFTDAMADKVQMQLEALGGRNSEMFYIGRLRNGSVQRQGAMVGTTLEYLALMELACMEAHSLLFSKAATFQTSNGVKRVNEGVWHQLRRGKLIKYSKPGYITIDHIHEAASYIYKNSQIPVNQRVIRFKAGYFAYLNVLQIFREEAVLQLQGLPAGMLGFDGQIPKVFSGPLDNLTMQEVAIRSVKIPGVGQVEIEHDPSLDYQPLTDRLHSGAFGQNMAADTSYSMVIWDAADSYYSNVTSKVKNANLVQGGTNRANIYYVKPEGPLVTYGYEQGRMANKTQFEDVQSSLKYMGRTFWAFNQSGALVLDTTRYVVIELDRKDRR